MAMERQRRFPAEAKEREKATRIQISGVRARGKQLPKGHDSEGVNGFS